MGDRTQRISRHWSEDFAARRVLAARYGIAAAENALGFLEQAQVLSEAEVLEDMDDQLEEEAEQAGEQDVREMEDSGSGDELDNMMAGVGRGEVFEGDSAKARAFALTIFATEEVAKAYATRLILWLHDDEDPSAWEAFWEIVGGRHQDKLQAALALEQVLPGLAGVRGDELSHSLRALVDEDIFRQRNRALYVDVMDGAVQTPEEFATDPAMERLREELAQSMVVWGIILQSDLTRQLETLEEGDRT